RFFTVNSLICLNIQEEENFKLYHQYIFDLVKKDVFQGLRIDHIDGLYDPKQYLDRLRKSIGSDVYVVVEKILEEGEEMPSNWETQGNTGYDFLSMVNNLFTNQANRNKFDQIYENVTGKNLDASILIEEKKRNILFEHMQGELNNLFELFFALELISKNEMKSVTAVEIKLGIAEILIQMPVYRYYNYHFPLPESDSDKLAEIINEVSKKTELKNVASFFKRLFLEESKSQSIAQSEKLSRFYQRLMQFTGPLMAKGVEDTVMFTYNRFVGHSEVGDSPNAFGISIREFHHKMIDRQKNWPLSLNGSSTHDTKRGEDFRARLNILTDIPIAWQTAVDDFVKSVQQSKVIHPIFDSVHNNDAYLVFQTILGIMPMPGEKDDDLQNRLELYVEKALREAKKRSDWAEPNEKYEQFVKDFVVKLLDEKEQSFEIINNLLSKIADFGILNSLSQLVLKFTCPGIPDVYQGTELWDLTLVDPDNRRKVNYKKINDYLEEELPLKKQWDSRYSGKIKLWLTKKIIKFRKENRAVFELGEYIPLKVIGKYQDNVFAFARKHKNNWVLVAVPIGLASVANKGFANDFNWEDTQIMLPKLSPTCWRNVISNQDDVKDFLNEGILVSQIFQDLQIGLIQLKQKQNIRNAGILMHITSLPSPYGIGDFGCEATKFVNFLAETDQKYWQILPLNPTKKENGHSPYSSNSSKAGNILLIDLEQLVSEGLLDESDLKSAELKLERQVLFSNVEHSRKALLSKAYQTFNTIKPAHLIEEYDNFCIAEQGWLADFALYTAIKSHHQRLEWYNWPTDFKTRNSKVLHSFESKYALEIDQVKWQQYIFFKQWHKLKDYSNSKGIEIIGDLPFYLDYDSVEVWSQPELFKLDNHLKPTHVAGVPPDYFNEDGQLWGMPIFNWELMKENGYEWWIGRLKKNMEMFDLLRLDHFRAFSSFWEVPAQDKNAINGTWQQGPGKDFFEKIKSVFPAMPFIAEDLGEITEEVERLRDDIKLPGMKVLQFAFGSHLAISPHIPHNFTNRNCIAYSGTHDNNTLRGWFNNEIDKLTKQRLITYLGREIAEKAIHKEIIRLTYASTAKTAIIPIQDILGLSGDARMNMPGKAEGNWGWRLNTDELSSIKSWLKELCAIFGRGK
ncbi:MAG: malto-oligosyltrehalose synthase, partial [Pedobacter sp.]